MKLSRFKSISFFGSEIVSVTVPKSKFGPSIADTTYFVPTSEAVRSLKAGDVPTSLYDFADGKDTGVEFPLARDRRSDLAQISQDIRRRSKTVSDALNDARETASYERKIAKKFEKNASSKLSEASSKSSEASSKSSAGGSSS